MNYLLETGTVLHGKSYDYRIIRILGKGSFGVTYLAGVHLKGELGTLNSEILVAVKEFGMRIGNGEDECTSAGFIGATAKYYKSEFIEEALKLSRLRNPSIVKVLERFEENGTSYYVMEYVSDESLETLINFNGRLDVSDGLAYAKKIAEALGYMHRNQMMHLDLKPSNIMIRRNGDIVFIDFGIARRFDPKEISNAFPKVGHGTPGYAPLEQSNYYSKFGGEFPATMDIYAFGATMFKMLSGKRPPEAWVVLNEGFPYVDLQNVGVPEKLIALIAKCMEPLCKKRYQTVEALSAALDAIESDATIAVRNKAQQGYFKRKHESADYSAPTIEKVAVTSALDFPEIINIKLLDNSRRGRSYQIVMSDGHEEDADCNFVKIWDKGKLIAIGKFRVGIPQDVKSFLISHGFLSTCHWENESSTSCLNDDCGTDASITMILPGKETFLRRVQHAHPDFHNLLLDELSDLINTTSLKYLIAKALALASDKTAPSEATLRTVPLQADTTKIEITHFNQSPGSGKYHLLITPELIKMRVSGYPIGNIEQEIENDSETFLKLLNEIGRWHYLPEGRKFSQNEFSEAPDSLLVMLYSESQTSPYLALESRSISRNNYGNLQGDSSYFSQRIISLIPQLEKLLTYAPRRHP